MSWYIGFTHNSKNVGIFEFQGIVTKKEFGTLYMSVGGPFKSKLEAKKYALADGYKPYSTKIKKQNPLTNRDKLIAARWKILAKKDKQELIHIFSQLTRIHSLTSKDPKLEILHAIIDYEFPVKRARYNKNPPQKVTEIYGNITAIEATKGKNSLWPREKFRHDFKQGGKIVGLSDGSLLVKPKKNKMLWKNFNY